MDTSTTYEASSEDRARLELTRTPADPEAVADILSHNRLAAAQSHGDYRQESMTLSSQHKLRSWENSRRYDEVCY